MSKQKVNCAIGTMESGRSHALLSASSSHRWLNCPPSARLCDSYRSQSSSYAAEGTDAHTLCEYELKVALGIPAKDPIPDLTYYNEEMVDCANSYASYILELVETAKQSCADPLVLIEQHLDFSRYVKGGFGTGDCVVIADGMLHIVDYKHGQGILVEADENSQLMLYGLAALEMFGCIYNIGAVCLTIYQPRRDNVSTYTVSTESLYQWAEEVLKPTAELAYSGDGDFNSGEWCRFCRAKAECRARAKANLELAAYDFREPALLENDEITAILMKADQLAAWVSDVKDFALNEALKGIKYDGFKLVEGRSNRRYTDESAVVEAAIAAGFDPYERKILGITAMTSLLGKKRFEEVLGGFMEKPPGKPTLVTDSDKRPAMHNAQQDFSEF